MNDDTIEGSIALVTGAARRLGRAVALALACEGVSVIVHYRSSGHEARAVAREVEACGVRAWTVQGDLARAEAVETLWQDAIDQAGQVDNPGQQRIHLRAEHAPGCHRRGAQPERADPRPGPAAAGAAVRGPGRAGRGGEPAGHARGDPRPEPRGIPPEQANAPFADPHDGARVCASGPGERGGPRGLVLPPPGKDERYLARLAESVPLRRHGSADDVAEAVVFLVRSAFVTGQVIFVDGGSHLRGNVHA